MKKILKNFAFLAIIATFVFALIACGDEDKNPPVGDENPPITDENPSADTECSHNFGEWQIDTPATCTENGVKKRVCSLCNEEETDTIIASGHNFTKEDTDEKYKVSAATCTEKAVYKKSCAICGEAGTETFESGKANGHDFTQEDTDEKYKVSAATCIAKAVYKKSCAVCGEVGTETFESGKANGHDFTKEDTDEKYKVSAATCIAKAVYKKSCAICGEAGTETFEHGDFGDHDFTKEDTSEKYQVSRATCIAKAVYKKSCAVCGEAGTETFEYGDFGDHDFTKEDSDIKYLVSEANCTEKAVYKKSCAVCGEAGDETFEYGEIVADNHVWGEWVPTKEATCTEDGLERRDCEKCDEFETNTLVAEGHHYKDGICKNCGEAIQATEGLEYTLNEDGESYTLKGFGEAANEPNIVIAAEYEGKPVTAIGDYAFANIQDDQWVNYFTNSVTIPNTVTSIGEGAFYFCLALTEIEIPSSITYISEDAFMGCMKLVHIRNFSSIAVSDIIIEAMFEMLEDEIEIDITIYEILTDEESEFENKLFVDENGVQRYYVGEDVYLLGYIGEKTVLDLSEYTDITSVHFYAFAFNEMIEQIILPNSVTDIGVMAFGDCLNLSRITLSKSLINISAYAFVNCQLTSIEIPSSVVKIEERFLYYCGSLERIEVAENNTSYHSAGNCLIETESKTLILGCKTSTIPVDGSVTSIGAYAFLGNDELTSVVIPGSVTSIGSQAFAECNNLTSIVISDGVTSIGSCAFEMSGLTSIEIPDSVTSIGDRAFAYCSGLTSIEIPNSVTSIGDYAFSSCHVLTRIDFGGTVDEWNAVEKGDEWNRGTWDHITVYCTDGTVAKDGTVSYFNA